MLYYDMNRKSFTLIELVMVLVIIGLLAAIIIPKFSQHRLKAALTATHANRAIILQALKLYYIETGKVPAGAPGLMNKLQGTCPNCTKVYLKTIPTTQCGYFQNNNIRGNDDEAGGWRYFVVATDNKRTTLLLYPRCFKDERKVYDILFPGNQDFQRFTIP